MILVFVLELREDAVQFLLDDCKLVKDGTLLSLNLGDALEVVSVLVEDLVRLILNFLDGLYLLYNLDFVFLQGLHAEVELGLVCLQLVVPLVAHLLERVLSESLVEFFELTLFCRLLDFFGLIPSREETGGLLLILLLSFLRFLGERLGVCGFFRICIAGLSICRLCAPSK